MYILGITGYPGNDCHDTSAALIKDNVVIAAAEQERFSRRKHAYGEGPYDAALYCLNAVGISLDEVDKIAISWELEEIDKYIPAGTESTVAEKLFPKTIFNYNRIPEIQFINHHLSHLTSSFYQSGFIEAACLIIDGQGENEAITLAKAKCGKVEILKKYPICYSLGAFYDAAAGYTGLGFDVPGKLMGLSPYGMANQRMPLHYDDRTGEFRTDLEGIDEKATTFIEVRDKYIEYFVKNNFPFRRAPFARVETPELMSYINFAASAQQTLETIIGGLANYLKKIAKCENLILAGGVALNCTSNGILDSKGIFKNIFVYPAANDAGCSVGAALEVARQNGLYDKEVPLKISNVYIGKRYTDEEYKIILNNQNFNSKYLSQDELIEKVSNSLTENKIIAWYQDGFEMGPRALGARSMLASPVERNTLLRMNKAKKREGWRPLSPIILDKYYKDIMEDENEQNMSEFMLKTCKIKKEWIHRIPAVVHIDYTTRPQYLRRSANPLLYSLIEAFYGKTGIPVLINTSFNVKRQPIVNSPNDALIALENNFDIDALVMGHWYIQRLDGFIIDDV